MIFLASLVCQQSKGMLTAQTERALAAGVTPVEIKEAVYHGSPNVGFPRTGDAVILVERVLLDQGIKLPLKPQTTVAGEDRFEKGLNDMNCINQVLDTVTK